MKNWSIRAALTALGLFLFVPGDVSAQGVESLTGPDYFAHEPELREYVDEALRHNPAIAQAAARYQASLQVIPQVKALPDPMLSFTQAIRSVETRVGPQRQTLMLTQTFPWFGTLGLRERVAVQAAAAQYHQYVASQRDVIREVKEVFYNLAYIDAALAITDEERSLLEHYEALAQARFATGQGLQQGVIRLQAEITRVINRLEMLVQQRRTLVARLNTLRDRSPEAEVAQVGSLTVPSVALDLEQLYRAGDRQRPELQAGRARIERSERSIALAGKAFWPSLTVGVGLQSIDGRTDPAGELAPPPDNGKNPLALSVGLTVPLQRGKYRAGVEQAGEELRAEREGYARDRNDMEFVVRDAVVRLQTLRSQIELFEQVLIPQTEETLAATEAAYETGQVGVLDLLDSERMRLDTLLINVRYQADYLVALAQLERAVGAAIAQE